MCKKVVAPAVLQSVTPTRKSMTVGDTVTVSWIFDKAPLLEHVKNADPVIVGDAIRLQKEGIIHGGEKAIKCTFIAQSEGSATATITVNGVRKTFTATVSNPV